MGAGPGHLPVEHDHSVQFYESGEFLAVNVAAYLAGSLCDGGAGIIVATAEHRAAFDGALRDLGLDLTALQAAGRMAVLDARETLDSFMRDGSPDPQLFRSAVGAVMDSLDPDAVALRVYGEMVAVLWADGDVASALALEDLWNDLVAERDFGLLCAYPIGAFDEPGMAAAFQRVCRQHRDVIPSEGYASVPPEEEGMRSRVVAELQREVRSLRWALDQASLQVAGAAPHPDSGVEGIDPLVARCAQLLREGDHLAVESLLADLATGGCSVLAALSRVVTPAMHLIGSLWQHGQITVADEHLATATCERLIAGLYPTMLTHRPRTRERILVAVAEGDAHGLGARVLSDALEGRGYQVIHLGADVPADSLALAVARHQPDLVALSITREAAADGLERCIAAAISARPGLLVLLGGQGVSPAWERLGWPVCRSLEDAPSRVEILLRERPLMPPTPTPPGPGPELVMPADGRANQLAERFSSIAAEMGTLAREQALRAHEYGFLALQDPLTGLPNRRAFEDAVVRARDLGRKTVLLLIDVDNFKRINDTYGHHAGDQVLRDVGQVLVDALRPEDLAARIGGDEFALLLPDSGNLDVAAVADRIRRRVQAQLAPAGATVSIGGAPLGDHALGLSIADRFLYQAKERGRNTVLLHARTAGRRPSQP